MLKVKTFVFCPFQENTYVVSDVTRSCVIIDPGCFNRDERAELDDYIRSEGLTPRLLLNTHCHIDHVFGNHYVKTKYSIPLLAHRLEVSNLERSVLFAEAMGLPFDPSPPPDQFLEEGEAVSFGETSFAVHFLPGHAAGHIAFLHEASRSIFSGDVLFAGSIGRTDLPGGNYETLLRSITEKLLPLGDDLRVYAGHLGVTTSGEERRSNPYILDWMGDRRIAREMMQQ